MDGKRRVRDPDYYEGDDYNDIVSLSPRPTLLVTTKKSGLLQHHTRVKPLSRMQPFLKFLQELINVFASHRPIQAPNPCLIAAADICTSTHILQEKDHCSGFQQVGGENLADPTLECRSGSSEAQTPRPGSYG